jgi:hypothetical protein
MGTARPSVAVCPCETRSCKLERTAGWKLEAGSFRDQPVSVVACQWASWCSLVGIVE